MKINVSKGDTYIPEWRGNKDLPEKEQIKVEFTYMTGEQEERLTPIIPTFNEKNEIQIEYKSNASAVWDECVSKISGLVGDDKEITDPGKVKALPGTYGLITEMVGHIRRELTSTDSKN